MLKIGDRIVCINDNFSSINYNKPIKGKIYTIRNFYHSKGGFGISVYLNEIYNENIFFGAEPSFSVDRFRKIDELFAENVIKNIKQEIEELELVCV